MARKLAERIWMVLTTGRPYELRDPTVSRSRPSRQGTHRPHTVDPAIRARATAHSAATHRCKLTR